MEQLLLHLWGDYLLQSDWMARNKTKANWPAAVHAMLYSLPFLFVLRPTLIAFLVILGTHFFIDRFRLARYVVWAKNWMGPSWSRRWVYVCVAHNYCAEAPGSKCAPRWADFDLVKHSGWDERQFEFSYRPISPLADCPNGYPVDAPVWLSTWLLIIADNVLHLTINYAALRWL